MVIMEFKHHAWRKRPVPYLLWPSVFTLLHFLALCNIVQEFAHVSVSLSYSAANFVFYLRLRWDVIRNNHVSVLRLFVDSIFIQTQISIQEGNILPDQLGMGAPLLSSQRERLRLVGKLLLVVDLAGWINDPSLSLQAAIMSYTILVPLIQLGIIAKPLLKVREPSFLGMVWSSSCC